MTALLIDTLKLATRLEDAGFTREQATGTAQALAEGLTNDIATKTDLDKLGSDLRDEIGSLRAELAKNTGDLRTDIAAVRSWIITAVLVNVVAFITIAAGLYGLLKH